MISEMVYGEVAMQESKITTQIFSKVDEPSINGKSKRQQLKTSRNY